MPHRNSRSTGHQERDAGGRFPRIPLGAGVDPDELPGTTDQPGLLPKLSDHGLLDRLVKLYESAGERPLPAEGRLPPSNEEDPTGPDPDRVDREGRIPVHGAGPAEESSWLLGTGRTPSALPRVRFLAPSNLSEPETISIKAGGPVAGLMQILRSKAPLRISFAGGGTDVSPYPEEKGGAVLNCTIDKFAYVTLESVPDGAGRISVESLDYGMTLNFARPSDLVYNGDLDVVKAALKVLGTDDTTGPSKNSLHLFLHSDAPPGTGLGTSSTMCVALVGAFQQYRREPWTSYEVAELAYRIEREELGLKGGRQDQYAAAFGGFNFMEFSGSKTIVNPLRIDPEVVNELAYRLLLCYTGTGHYSNDIIERQQRSYTEKRSDTVTALDATKQLAIDMKNELLRGNLDEMGRLLDEGWQHKKQFTEGISNERIDAFYARAREAGAIGGKLLGAGGGGYILLFCDFARRAQVAKAVSSAGGRVTDFALETEGLQTWSVLSPRG